MNDPTALTDRLDLALAAGVPEKELERIGLHHWTQTPEPCWYTFGGDDGEDEIELSQLAEEYTTQIRFAFERVVIEWMSREEAVSITPNCNGSGLVRIRTYFEGKKAAFYEGPTLTTALTAALRQIKEGS